MDKMVSRCRQRQATEHGESPPNSTMRCLGADVCLSIRRPDPDGSSTPEGQVYLRLLSTPNVKSIVHMLADHVQDMDNNYITEIHTFPQILSRQNVNVATERMAHIILVLGPKPGQSDQPVGTVQTA